MTFFSNDGFLGTTFAKKVFSNTSTQLKGSVWEQGMGLYISALLSLPFDDLLILHIEIFKSKLCKIWKMVFLQDFLSSGENSGFYANFCLLQSLEYWLGVSHQKVTSLTSYVQITLWPAWWVSKMKLLGTKVFWYYFCIKNNSLYISSKLHENTVQKIHCFTRNSFAMTVSFHEK